MPDIIMTCAGVAIPKLFIEAPIEDFEKQMQLNYFGTLYTVHVRIAFEFFFGCNSLYWHRGFELTQSVMYYRRVRSAWSRLVSRERL